MITAYRVPSGFTLPKGATVAQVIEFETVELGNDLRISQVEFDMCADKPARCCAWVCFDAKSARRYGKKSEVCKIGIEAMLVIAEDGDNGYLVVDMAGNRIHA